MICPKEHAQESLRLKTLRTFSILDSIVEKEYDSVTSIAANITDSPIALISFIDKDRQWFKSYHGLDVRETPREYAFCAHAINSKKSILIVKDARIDPRFKNNPYVTGSPNVVFYAAVILRDENNMPLGSLCVIDNKPRHLNEYQLNALKTLANQVMDLLNQRKSILALNFTIDNLKKQNKELEQFAFEMAHDLKSPIINIGALGDYLKTTSANVLDEESKTIVSLIQSSAEQLKHLIDDTLNYYIGVNKIQEQISSIPLKEFFDQIFELFNHDSSVHLNLKTSLEKITFNKNTLKLIIINLISNAIRYNNKKITNIEIGVSENNHSLKFYVKDNGPGIPEELHEKVFQLFTVGHLEDRYGETSKGIGLATVKKLIERFGGSIRLENGKVDGCMFIFRIPNILKPLILN